MTYQSVDDVLEQVSREETDVAARLAGRSESPVCAVPNCGKEARHRGRHANQGDRYKKIVTEETVEAFAESLAETAEDVVEGASAGENRDSTDAATPSTTNEPDTGFTTLERVFLFWLAVLTFLVVIALVVK